MESSKTEFRLQTWALILPLKSYTTRGKHEIHFQYNVGVQHFSVWFQLKQELTIEVLFWYIFTGR